MNLVGSSPNTPQKKKFGGSLRKLFHLRRRSSSSNRANDRRADLLNDLDRPFSPHYDRISVERDDRASHSSQERDETLPHRRVLSTSSSRYSYNSQTSPELMAPLNNNQGNTISFQDADNLHYSLPTGSKRLPAEL